jgi:hypothetical protein
MRPLWRPAPGRTRRSHGRQALKDRLVLGVLRDPPDR